MREDETVSNQRKALVFERFGNGAIDARSWRGRVLYESYNNMISDLGGHDYCSSMEKIMAKQAAMLVMISEEYNQQKVEEDENYEYLEHITCIRTLNQVLRTLGMKRRARPTNEVPSLKEYTKRKRRAEPDEEV